MVSSAIADSNSPVKLQNNSKTMAASPPLYSRVNCLFAYQLHWTLLLYWRYKVSDAKWWSGVQRQAAEDGIQLVRHGFVRPGLSQIELSSTPNLSPLSVIHKLQHHIRDYVNPEIPNAILDRFHLRSVGWMTRQAVERVLQGKCERNHPADKEFDSRWRNVQLPQPFDLSLSQRDGQGIYSYNLHIVLEYDEEQMQKHRSFVSLAHREILQVSRRRRLRLSRAAILSDHIDLVLGCPIRTAPVSVALCFMNDLANACLRDPMFSYSAFVATLGETEWQE